MANNHLKVIPLGGLGEIGKNITVFESDNDIIIVDCGVAFPEDAMLGIDAVIPDFTYLTENKDKVRAIFITHGHEDHIGGLPYLLRELNVPIYGTRFTIALIQKKLEETGQDRTADLQIVKQGEVVLIGDFAVEFIRTNHSIADAVAFAITTPAGLIVHTGDFKVDYTPIDGAPIDLMRLAELGESGVLMLMSDSTNAERKGFTMSESTVGQTFETIFARTHGRIIVATFSSNVHRVQQIIDIASKFGRKCVVCGRSMVNVIECAVETGYMKNTDDVLIDIEDMNNYPPEQIVIITTGSQGEPMSALTRMAISMHKQVDILPGDTVIISASPIPGNEKPIAKMIDELFRRGANVIYKALADVHVSGHACEEELKLIMTVTKPQFFFPVHGEFRHLIFHKNIALKMGIPEENIFIGENGAVIEFKDDEVIAEDTVTAGNVLVDGLGIGDVGTIVLRDRRHMSTDGVMTIAFSVDPVKKKIVAGPEIASRGFMYLAEAGDIVEKVRNISVDLFNQKDDALRLGDWNTKKNLIKDAVHQYIFETTRRNPIILPIILEERKEQE